MFRKCPRCWQYGLEVLKTHCYCFNCNWSNELEDKRLNPNSRPTGDALKELDELLKNPIPNLIPGKTNSKK